MPEAANTGTSFSEKKYSNDKGEALVWEQGTMPPAEVKGRRPFHEDESLVQGSCVLRRAGLPITPSPGTGTGRARGGSRGRTR